MNWIHDLIAHIAFLYIASGMYMIAINRRDGFLFRLSGDSTLCIIGIMCGISSLALWSFIFAALDTIAYVNWSKYELGIEEDSGRKEEE